MGIKTILQEKLIDPLQFRYDVFPRLGYQPLPSIGKHKAKRSAGTIERWDIIEKRIEGTDIKTALDVGCQVGFFSLALAAKGIPTLGVDSEDRFVRIARYVARKTKTENIGFLAMLVSPDTVNLLPEADLVLVLSIWHHWVRSFGIERATEILERIWGQCRTTMFFETGEDEMPDAYGLPRMEPTPHEWLEVYLTRTCPGSTVEHLGQFRAFGPGGDNTRHAVLRNLFRVARE